MRTNLQDMNEWAQTQTCIRLGQWIQPIKGTWSRDGLELSWYVWVYPGLRKGRGRFLNFSDAQIPDKNKKFYISLGKCETHAAIYC
jgi:hypothetical protein